MFGLLQSETDIYTKIGAVSFVMGVGVRNMSWRIFTINNLTRSVLYEKSISMYRVVGCIGFKQFL